jgi:hypothetical protein
VVIEKLVDAEGCILFPEDRTFEVLDNRGTVKAGPPLLLLLLIG